MYEASIPEFSFRKRGVCNVITKKIFAKYVLNSDLRPQMDCFARHVWNTIVTFKLEMIKLLGRFSQQQGLFGRECAQLYLTAETWGVICHILNFNILPKILRESLVRPLLR
jgi:hypothetical protein